MQIGQFSNTAVYIYPIV